MATTLELTLQPTTAIRGHLRRTRDGGIWASYRMHGLPYGYTSVERKTDALNHHKNLFKNLPNNSIIAGLVAAIDPDEIVANAIRGTDVNANPNWRAECEGKKAYFTNELRATERVFILSFPVIEADNNDLAELADLVKSGRRSTAREHAELSKAAAAAEAVVRKLPSVFAFEPLTGNQMVWLWNQALTRGGPPPVFPAGVASNVSARAGAFRQASFDEGARTGDVAKWKPSSFSPLVKITQPGAAGAQPSYQCLLAIESLPLEGMQFPGSEFFTIADRVPNLDIDWAFRISKTSRQQAITRNTKNLRRLKEQADERDTEVSFIQDTLSDQVDLLAEYNHRLESNDDEVEIAMCPIFVVASPTRAGCEDGALKLSQQFERNHIKLIAPLGGQRELWAAMNPGGTRHRAVTDFSHVTISQYAAASIPCGTNTVGDAYGPIFALTLAGRRKQPVHLEWFREAIKNASPSVALAAELGAGKTWAIMFMLFHCLDAFGGQFLTTDRTDTGEYANMAVTVPRHAVVDLLRPDWSMDPLRIFPSNIGVDKTVDLFTPLFGCHPHEPMGLTLGEILRPDWGVDSTPRMLELLEAGVKSDQMPDGKPLMEGWKQLYQHLNYWSSRHYAATLFNQNLKPLPLDADAIVIRTNRVELPEVEEIAQGVPLSPTKIFGRAMYGLSAEIGRQLFSNPKRFGVIATDEAHHVTASPQGLSSITRTIREGRRQNTGVILGSHDPLNDYPKNTALDLISTRIVMRQRDETLARRSLQWIGVDPDANSHMLRDLMYNTSPKTPEGPVEAGREGEGYMRDARGAIGRIQVLGPSSPQRRAAMTTTPDMSAA
ncbi:hypothetical protein AWB85_21445 [Mycobacteroides immunogenum]|uniref:Uncharacterized protein n=1 Tax=Mycobacteroides immunogenum TaxID=83262 RepID=A0A179VDX7_9MYCO|nr:ATP-binding protein [Mycobacteroides immunogenum]OAT69332.1 hypothetical protein AWB85_21445 [Mycobacteroides immunogenum]